jgi:predicted nucleotidyltransferase
MINLKSKIASAVLGYFILHEEAEMYINEMARKFKLDSGNLTRKLAEFEKEGILKSRLSGKQKYFSISKSFSLLKEYKQIIQKTIGFEHILKESLSDLKGIKKVVLFGSYAEDSLDLLSDIDLLVVGNHNTIDLQKKIAKIQRNIDREINVLSYGVDEYNKKKIIDPLLKSIHKKNKINII